MTWFEVIKSEEIYDFLTERFGFDKEWLKEINAVQQFVPVYKEYAEAISFKVWNLLVNQINEGNPQEALDRIVRICRLKHEKKAKQNPVPSADYDPVGTPDKPAKYDAMKTPTRAKRIMSSGMSRHKIKCPLCKKPQVSLNWRDPAWGLICRECAQRKGLTKDSSNFVPTPKQDRSRNTGR
tara:strand:+ start:574 stop:1116 length:543 start_codon:yes stop_codon:yes gene_type:complete